MEMRTSIYSLTDETEIVRYIGKTSLELGRRLGTHLTSAKRGEPSRRNDWIREVLKRGGSIQINLLEVVDGNGDAEERAWIAKMWATEWPLVNSSIGGEGLHGELISKEQRARIRERLLGHPVSAETIAKISATKRANGVTQKQREQLERLHKSRIGKPSPKSPEHRAKISATLTGRPHPVSVETALKISKALTGRKLSPEHVAKCTAAKIGRKLPPFTEEHKARISATKRRKREELLCLN